MQTLEHVCEWENVEICVYLHKYIYRYVKDAKGPEKLQETWEFNSLTCPGDSLEVKDNFYYTGDRISSREGCTEQD